MGNEKGAEGILERAETHLPRDAVRLRHVFGLARDRGEVLRARQMERSDED